MGDFLSAIPQLVLYGCVGLIVFSVAMFIWLIVQARAVMASMKALRTALSTHEAGTTARRNGLTLEQLDNVRMVCGSLEDEPRNWWEILDSHTESYSSHEDIEGWFITETPRHLLPFDFVVGRHFNSALFGSVPALLAGVGLALTFVAILVALYGVHYDRANAVEPISGIDVLINGLAGKFLSSIVALAMSILFTISEKWVIRRIRATYDHLVAAVGRTLPHLSSARILLDIRRYTHDQTVSISHISSDVVDRFVGAFNTSVVPNLANGMSAGVADKLQIEFRPTMQQMITTLESLQSAVLSLESQKQESVTGEIRILLTSLESSLVSALSKMGDDFHHALTGAANKEFGNVQGTLEATRQMLSEMNAQFSAMQTAFATIIEKAEQSTSDQMNAGREQTEALTTLMNGLIVRMQESADQNLGTVRNQLTLVVGDLAQRVGTLSQNMMTAADSVAKQAQASASDVLHQTGEWSEATARRLEALLSNIEVRSSDFQKAGQTLLHAKDLLTEILGQNAAALGRMADASRQVQAYSASLAGQGESLKDISTLQSHVVTQLRETSGNIKASQEQNQQLLTEYRRTFFEYKSVIDELDQNLGKILTTLQAGLRDYNQSIENNFQRIVEISNPMISEASSYLRAQIEELSDQFEELGSVIAKAMGSGNGRPR